MNDIAKRIHGLMQEQDLSYADLSQKTGIPKSALQRYATGNTAKIPMDRIEAIASALDVSAAYLIGWTDEWVEAWKRIITENIISGRTDAEEEMFRLFGDKHQVQATRLFGEKAALLCYKVLDPDSIIELSYIISMLDDLNESELKKIEMLIYAYQHADASIREIVDTALKPYWEEESLDTEDG